MMIRFFYLLLGLLITYLVPVQLTAENSSANTSTGIWKQVQDPCKCEEPKLVGNSMRCHECGKALQLCHLYKEGELMFKKTARCSQCGGWQIGESLKKQVVNVRNCRCSSKCPCKASGNSCNCSSCDDSNCSAAKSAAPASPVVQGGNININAIINQVILANMGWFEKLLFYIEKFFMDMLWYSWRNSGWLQALREFFLFLKYPLWKGEINSGMSAREACIAAMTAGFDGDEKTILYFAPGVDLKRVEGAMGFGKWFGLHRFVYVGNTIYQSESQAILPVKCRYPFLKRKHYAVIKKSGGRWHIPLVGHIPVPKPKLLDTDLMTFYDEPRDQDSADAEALAGEFYSAVQRGDKEALEKIIMPFSDLSYRDLDYMRRLLVPGMTGSVSCAPWKEIRWVPFVVPQGMQTSKYCRVVMEKRRGKWYATDLK